MNRIELKNEYKSDRKMRNDIIWHQCQPFFHSGQPKKVTGQRKTNRLKKSQRANQLSGQAHSEMAKAAVLPVKSRRKAHNS